MSSDKTRSCLVVTYGPVPTPQYQTIEGGGMRAWGLAKGLAADGISVTVAINNSFPQATDEHDGIKLINWSPDEHFKNVLNSFDAVIVSYCMGSDSIFIADNINDNVQLILDAYVPIYVEVSAREAKNMDDEYALYMADVARYNHVLKRGDYFLCASETQKIYYTGVLSSLGIINPRSYREDRVIITPFGIHDEPAKAEHNPYKKLGVEGEDFLVLWFGGLYPWFKVDEFLEAVKELSGNPKIKFAIVGGKNPFNPNPAFSEQYDKALKFAREHKLIDKNLFFIDWVDFDKRMDWYGRANVVISINNPGEENTFSWRTRVMDYVWGELPILTNGGDPLSEQLLQKSAAIRLPSLSQASIANAIKELVANPSKLEKVRQAVIKAKPSYFWPTVIRPVARVVKDGQLPNTDEASYRKAVGVSEPEHENINSLSGAPLSFRRPIELSRRALKHARNKGLKRSAYLAYTIGKTQFKRKVPIRQHKKFIFVSHPIDNSGAPMVLLSMAEEYADKYGGSNVRIIAPGILPHHLKRLRQKNVSVEKAALALGDRAVDLQLGMDDGDFLLINTLAVYPNYLGFIMRALSSGRIKHAYWFIHEDKAQIPFVAPQLLEDKETEVIANHVKNKRLTLLVPSKRIKEEYEKLWGVKDIRVTHLRVSVPEKLKRPRPASDYAKLNFLLSGTASDARKGQLLALSAFYYFIKNYYEKSPAKYRDFSLTFTAIGDDYVSQQIKAIGSAFLASRLHIYPSLPMDEALELTAKCNAVIGCSLNETFGLSIAEGMFMGHVVLRNDSAGMVEQLKNGVNGYSIDHTDIKQFASVIEKLLNKKTTNEKLQKKGAASQKIIAPYADNSYLL